MAKPVDWVGVARIFGIIMDASSGALDRIADHYEKKGVGQVGQVAQSTMSLSQEELQTIKDIRASQGKG